MEPIRSILLDADGVIQMPSPEWRDSLVALAGDGERANDFIADIFAAEEPCITGLTDFAASLEGVLTRWECDASVDDVLRLWTLIEPDPQVIELVRGLRARGHSVCLATNQQRHRADYMAKVLGYDELFDQSFYSCEVGIAKPERAYFIELIERLGVKGSEVLFIDDRDSNVDVARQVGLHAEQFHVMEGVDVLRRKLAMYDIEA